MGRQIITLLSDLGTLDAGATVAKAILMRHAPAAVFVDISHSVKEYDLQQAAYLLLSAYPHFSKGTIHVLLVDVFSGDGPRMLLAEKDGYFFIAPDNGILSLGFGSTLERAVLCHEFSKPFIFQDWVNTAGEVIAAISTGTTGAYAPCDLKAASRPQLNIIDRGIECNILYIDRYGNIVLDITRPQFEELLQNRPFRIVMRKVQDITTVSNNYNDVSVGNALCRFNSAGFMEIALNHDNAATLLGLNTGLRYPAIRIFF